MPRITIAPCDLDTPGFADLVAELDAEMQARYPAQSNHLDSIETLARGDVYAVGAFDLLRQVGCGTFRVLHDDGIYAEVKRVYVTPAYRRQGLSRCILGLLEQEMARRGLALARLETGVLEAAALTLYEHAGYHRRGPFGQYREDPNSVYFEKPLDLVC